MTDEYVMGSEPGVTETGLGDSDQDMEAELDDEFFTPGPSRLVALRKRIATESLKLARQRVLTQRNRYDKYDQLLGLQARRAYYKQLSQVELQGSQIVSSRFTSSCKYSPDGKQLAAGSWDGGLYLFETATLDPIKSYSALHTEKLSALDWSGQMIITGGGDGKVKLIRGERIDTLEGHEDRVTSVKRMGQLAVSASFDTTWRLWDLEHNEQLYFQEGHSKPLTTLAVHPDGSLLASGGLDSLARVWDLRTGRSISILQKNGHVKPIHAMSWRHNGYQLLTGGADNAIKVWDLRRSETAIETVAVHTKVVTDISVSEDDQFFASCSYDGQLVLTACDSFVPIKRFQNVDKLMCCDVHDSQIIAGGWDRSIKLYS